MKDQELIDILKQQAKEIADANIAGWGNTMTEAANRLEQLVMPNEVVAGGNITISVESTEWHPEGGKGQTYKREFIKLDEAEKYYNEMKIIDKQSNGCHRTEIRLLINV